MSRPRFLADEDFRGTIVRALRRKESMFDIVTVVEENLASATDDEVLEFAWRHEFLVVSHDVTTMKYIAERRIADGRTIHGLFIVPQQRAISSIVESMLLIWEASQFEEWRDRIVFLPF
jgi:hypothetical protein